MTPRDQLKDYCDAFNRRELDKALALFAVRALFEMPLLGQRLIGRREIGAGLARVFELTQSADIQLSTIEEAAQLVMGEGVLTARLYRGPAPVSIPLAIALEVEEQGIARLSMYLDARPYRPWADGPIFASGATPPRGTG